MDASGIRGEGQNEIRKQRAVEFQVKGLSPELLWKRPSLLAYLVKKDKVLCSKEYGYFENTIFQGISIFTRQNELISLGKNKNLLEKRGSKLALNRIFERINLIVNFFSYFVSQKSRISITMTIKMIGIIGIKPQKNNCLRSWMHEKTDFVEKFRKKKNETYWDEHWCLSQDWDAPMGEVVEEHDSSW